jgi:hypothetical protein
MDGHGDGDRGDLDLMYIQPAGAYTTPVFSAVPTGAWQTIDVSAIVGSAARMCQLKVSGINSAGFRAVGNTNDYEIGLAECRGSANTQGDAGPPIRPGRVWVSTNAAGQFQLKAANTANLDVYLVGWHDSTSVDPVDSTGGIVAVGAAWTAITPPSGPGAAALCLLGHKNDQIAKVVSLRPSDETENVRGSTIGIGGPARHTGNVAGNDYFGSVIPTGPTGAIAGYGALGVGSTNVTTYTHAYDTDWVASGVELFATALGPAAWTTLDCTLDTTSSPTGVSGKTLVYLKFMRTAAGPIATYAIQNSEDPANYVPTVTAKAGGCVACLVVGTLGGYMLVETDTSGQIEWITTDATQTVSIDLVGYVPGAVHGSSTATTTYQFTSWPER